MCCSPRTHRLEPVDRRAEMADRGAGRVARNRRRHTGGSSEEVSGNLMPAVALTVGQIGSAFVVALTTER